MQICDILSFLDLKCIEYSYQGKNNLKITTFSSIKEIKENSIIFLKQVEEPIIQIIESFDNILLIVPRMDINLQSNCIFVEDPRTVFFIILDRFFAKKLILQKDIAKSAIVESIRIGNNVSVGQFSYISKDSIIGDYVTIGNNVSINGKVKIGNNTYIESGVVIGEEGYGHYVFEEKKYHIKHFGGVIIGNNVFIGGNTVIAKGTLSDTIIADDVKIGALCHIGHNVEICDRVSITSGCIISGSVILERGCRIHPNASISNHTIIQSGSLVGIGAVVLHDVEENDVVVGNPVHTIRKVSDNDKKRFPF